MSKAFSFHDIPDAAVMAERLKWPEGMVDVILDTDTYNEIDDQFALSYLVRSDEKCRVRALNAAPFYRTPGPGAVQRSVSPEDGMEKSYDEILRLLDLLGRNDLAPLVKKGSREYLPEDGSPVVSEAAENIIRISREYSPEHPLYVVAIGAITNVASALLMDPTLKDRIVVVWLGGHARHMGGGLYEFNMSQDVPSARVVFGCGVPFVQLPCLGVVSEFRFTKADLEFLFRDRNPLCNYLIDSTYAYASQKFGYEPWSKPLWDVTAIGWLISRQFCDDRLVPSAVPLDDWSYSDSPNSHLMRYVYYIHKDSLAIDLVNKLTR